MDGESRKRSTETMAERGDAGQQLPQGAAKSQKKHKTTEGKGLLPADVPFFSRKDRRVRIRNTSFPLGEGPLREPSPLKPGGGKIRGEKGTIKYSFSQVRKGKENKPKKGEGEKTSTTWRRLDAIVRQKSPENQYLCLKKRVGARVGKRAKGECKDTKKKKKVL